MFCSRSRSQLGAEPEWDKALGFLLPNSCLFLPDTLSVSPPSSSPPCWRDRSLLHPPPKQMSAGLGVQALWVELKYPLTTHQALPRVTQTPQGRL